MCRICIRAGGRVHIIVSRLPRLLTDQTATVLPVATENPLKVMPPVVRTVQSARQTNPRSAKDLIPVLFNSYEFIFVFLPATLAGFLHSAFFRELQRYVGSSLLRSHSMHYGDH